MSQTTLLSAISIGIGLGLLAANGRLSRSLLGYWDENRRTNDLSRAVFEYNQRSRFGRFMTREPVQRWFVRGWWLLVAFGFVWLGVGGLA